MEEQDLRRARTCSWVEKSETTKRHKGGDICDCLWPLSPAVLRRLEETSEIADPLPDGLSQRMLELVQTSEVLWKSPLPDNIAVDMDDCNRWADTGLLD